MEGQQQKQEHEQEQSVVKSRVVKVDSKESWDLFLNQAQSQGCPGVLFASIISGLPSTPFCISLTTDSMLRCTRRCCKHCMHNQDCDTFHCCLVHALCCYEPIFRRADSQLPGHFVSCGRCHELKEVASKMEVKAMPTFVFMREGVQVDKIVGANRDEMKKRIDTFCFQHSLAEVVVDRLNQVLWI